MGEIGISDAHWNNISIAVQQLFLLRHLVLLSLGNKDVVVWKSEEDAGFSVQTCFDVISGLQHPVGPANYSDVSLA